MPGTSLLPSFGRLPLLLLLLLLLLLWWLLRLHTAR
jgi:hypothetical protein